MTVRGRGRCALETAASVELLEGRGKGAPSLNVSGV